MSIEARKKEAGMEVALLHFSVGSNWGSFGCHSFGMKKEQDRSTNETHHEYADTGIVAGMVEMALDS